MKSISILELKPTQFSLGMVEVQSKLKKLRKLTSKKLKNEIKKLPVPVIIGPKGECHMIDHHHAVYCYWLLGRKKVFITVKADLSGRKMSHLDFWKLMTRRHWAYLYDQFGEGPRPALYLPQDIRGMADDPYRSLAWIVREEGGYENTTKTFAEFQWAGFFRNLKLMEENGRSGMYSCLSDAIHAAQSAKAKKLPGYVGSKSRRLKNQKPIIEKD